MSIQPLSNNQQPPKPSNKEIWSNFKKMDLVQVARDLYGYVVDHKVSYYKNDGNLEPVYKHYTHVKLYQPASVGGEKKQSNVILIRKNRLGEYFYTSVSSPSDQGSIVDFIGNRNFYDPKEKTDLGKIAKIITTYAGGSYVQTVLPTYTPAPIVVKDRNAIVARFYKLLSKFEHPEYLIARGITKETLETSELKDRIYNSLFYDAQKNPHVNIAFPVVDRHDNLCGIEHKNIGFSGYEKESDRQIWRSNVLDPSKPIDAIIIGEAVIDVISYAQMKNLFGKNILLVAHTGNLTNDQIETIQYLINEHQPKKVILVEDRDAPGYRYDINLTGGLTTPATPSKVIPENDMTAELNIRDRVKAVLQVKFAFKDIEEGRNKGQAVLDSFEELNAANELKVYTTIGEGIKFGNNSATLKVEFHVSELNLKRALGVITAHRGLQEFIQIEKPTGARKNGEKISDWNELLMKEMNIDKEDIKTLVLELQKKSAPDSTIIHHNGFKPKELLQVFLTEWDKDILTVQKNAVEAGVNVDVISQTIAKGQLMSFNNFVATVQRTYDLEKVNYPEFQNFQSFLSSNEEKYKQVIQTKKVELAKLDDQLSLVKAKLQFEGDTLSMPEFDDLMKSRDTLEHKVTDAKRSLGQYNEYKDMKYLEELEAIVLSKTHKQWDKIVAQTLPANKNDTEVIANINDKKSYLKQ